MNSFPKKYKTQDLRNRAKIYREKFKNYDSNDKTSHHFFLNTLPISQKISYQDFFSIYMSDFFSYKKSIENKQFYPEKQNNTFEQLFTVYWDQLKSICSSYDFFNKKNQTLSQIWTNKLERHITSCNKKIFNINKKILDSYLSSPHKIYISDSDMYLYILNKFHSLRNEGRIKKETKIWYRSFNLQTSIPSQNILRKEEKIPYYTLKYFVGAKCEALPVCVEDIDICCGDVALLVHPKDKRYNKYIGKNAIIPLCNRQIPIIWDENVNIALNNWIQRICPCANEESIQLAKKYWLPTDIYVFNKQWLYTEYIHESAFIWQEREKYYNNIVWFIEDIGNLAQKFEKLTKIPYLNYTNERLVPYKIDQFTINFTNEKQQILKQIFDWNLKFSFLKKDFWEIFQELSNAENELNDILNNDTKNLITQESDLEENNNESIDETEILQSKILQLKQQIINWIGAYIPDTIICNSQLPYWWKLPIKKDKNFTFFDIEQDCLKRKEKPLQYCFNFVLLSLIREWVIKNKVYEYDKLFYLLSQNEKKIQYFVQHLSTITWEKSEYKEFLQIIQNLGNENPSTNKDCIKLIKNCKYINQEWDWLLINIEWLSDDVIDPEFIYLCTPCYLNSNNIQIDNHVIIGENQRTKTFASLLIQELLLWKTIFNEFTECWYLNYEFLWNKKLNKTQIEQSQRDSFLTYWENPVRLNFLINQTYDQKEILLNNIFLKQIWNAVRLCIQKDFLPTDIEKCLNNQPQTFESFDTTVLYKLEELRRDWQDIKNYEEYCKFFNLFKASIQNIFFSWYLEIQKIHPTKDVQFVCSYFFNFLFTILYPLIPEFIDALQYVSKRSFIFPIKSVESCKSIDYNMNFLFNLFTKIKDLKIEHNIQQHEPCTIFIKANPSILEIFNKHEQIFKNYFHISEVIYLRLHEQTPLWYEVFSDETITFWLQSESMNLQSPKNSIEAIEMDIKNLEDKLNLLRQRIQLLPEWEDRKKVEEEYAKTKEEIENLTIKHSILSSK